ncbi:hypothetical protein HYH02_000761 [Chlamydomonas schloesseri]|uniref:Uncharacterized protein n=1 Tax=Chlamydomonas schloesseri TaxID=2026947 RepID=A0A835WV85_9CHLO|nr:hypothetical protein HYH02_000761 [Chlamydomonas schloesseri]|eukprot:KAG2454933.1 hypothetical protein HYH02_000761 [Chlamydomonas schloesseri]
MSSDGGGSPTNHMHGGIPAVSEAHAFPGGWGAGGMPAAPQQQLAPQAGAQPLCTICNVTKGGKNAKRDHATSVGLTFQDLCGLDGATLVTRYHSLDTVISKINHMVASTPPDQREQLWRVGGGPLCNSFVCPCCGRLLPATDANAHMVTALSAIEPTLDEQSRRRFGASKQRGDLAARRAMRDMLLMQIEIYRQLPAGGDAPTAKILINDSWPLDPTTGIHWCGQPPMIPQEKRVREEYRRFFKQKWEEVSNVQHKRKAAAGEADVSNPRPATRAHSSSTGRPAAQENPSAPPTLRGAGPAASMPLTAAPSNSHWRPAAPLAGTSQVPLPLEAAVAAVAAAAATAAAAAAAAGAAPHAVAAAADAGVRHAFCTTSHGGYDGPQAGANALAGLAPGSPPGLHPQSYAPEGSPQRFGPSPLLALPQQASQSSHHQQQQLLPLCSYVQSQQQQQLQQQQGLLMSTFATLGEHQGNGTGLYLQPHLQQSQLLPVPLPVPDVHAPPPSASYGPPPPTLYGALLPAPNGAAPPPPSAVPVGNAGGSSNRAGMTPSDAYFPQQQQQQQPYNCQYGQHLQYAYPYSYPQCHRRDNQQPAPAAQGYGVSAAGGLLAPAGSVSAADYHHGAAASGQGGQSHGTVRASAYGAAEAGLGGAAGAPARHQRELAAAPCSAAQQAAWPQPPSTMLPPAGPAVPDSARASTSGATLAAESANTGTVAAAAAVAAAATGQPSSSYVAAAAATAAAAAEAAGAAPHAVAAADDAGVRHAFCTTSHGGYDGPQAGANALAGLAPGSPPGLHPQSYAPEGSPQRFGPSPLLALPQQASQSSHHQQQQLLPLCSYVQSPQQQQLQQQQGLLMSTFATLGQHQGNGTGPYLQPHLQQSQLLPVPLPVPDVHAPPPSASYGPPPPTLNGALLPAPNGAAPPPPSAVPVGNAGGSSIRAGVTPSDAYFPQQQQQQQQQQPYNCQYGQHLQYAYPYSYPQCHRRDDQQPAPAAQGYGVSAAGGLLAPAGSVSAANYHHGAAASGQGGQSHGTVRASAYGAAEAGLGGAAGAPARHQRELAAAPCSAAQQAAWPQPPSTMLPPAGPAVPDSARASTSGATLAAESANTGTVAAAASVAAAATGQPSSSCHDGQLSSTDGNPTATGAAQGGDDYDWLSVFESADDEMDVGCAV